MGTGTSNPRLPNQRLYKLFLQYYGGGIKTVFSIDRKGFTMRVFFYGDRVSMFLSPFRINKVVQLIKMKRVSSDLNLWIIIIWEYIHNGFKSGEVCTYSSVEIDDTERSLQPDSS